MNKVELDIENQLISLALNYNKSVGEICSRLEVESFLNTQNRIVFGAIKRLNKNNRSVNVSTVMDELNKSNLLDDVGGKEYLLHLSDKVYSNNTAKDLIEIVYKNWQQREMGLTLNALQRDFQNTTDYESLLLDARKKFNSINLNFEENNIQSVDESSQNVLNKLKYYRDNPSKINYLKTTFRGVDKILGSFEVGSLNIIGARAGVGKTSFSLTLAEKMASYFKQIQQKSSVLYLSIEMSQEQIARKWLSREANVSLRKLRFGEGLTQGDWLALQKAQQKLNELNPYLFLSDDTAITVSKLKMIIERYKREHNLKVIFIDYIQLMLTDKGQTETHIQLDNLARDLKKLATSENVVIIAMSQVNRRIDERKGKTFLSDLNGSAGLENHSSVVMFIERPDYYKDGGEPEICDVEISIKKNRFGAIGDVPMKFDKAHNRFFEEGDYEVQ